MTEQTTLQALTRRRIALIAAYAVTVAAYAAAILLILVDLRYAVAVVNVATLFYLLVVRRMDKRYELAFANASMRYGCGHCLQDVAVKTKARDALSHAQVEQMSLLPTREAGGVATSMEMTGRLDGRSVKVCEAAFCYDLPASSRQKIGLSGWSLSFPAPPPTPFWYLRPRWMRPCAPGTMREKGFTSLQRPPGAGPFLRRMISTRPVFCARARVCAKSWKLPKAA